MSAPLACPRAKTPSRCGKDKTKPGNPRDERFVTSMTEEQVLEAELTWTGTRFERGVHVVVRDGVIASVGQALTAPTHRLSGQALLPGFVNCHSHSFQRGLRGRGETYPQGRGISSFWTWRESMYSLVESLETEEAFYRLALQCFEEMRSSGITTVGEFHYLHHAPGAASFTFDDAVLRAATAAGVRICLLNAFYNRSGFSGDEPLSTAQRRFETASVEEYFHQLDRLSAALKPTQSLGVVAHSLRAVSVDDLGALHRGSVERGLPFHLHIEEQPLEVQQCVAVHGMTPMELLLSTIEVDARTTAVHCNHTTPASLRAFTRRGGNVCVCPLTEGSLGDGVMAELKACGKRVCLGTDCNARICFLEEMRWLEYSQRLARLQRGVCVEAGDTSDEDERQADGEKAGSTEDAGAQLLHFATRVGARSLNLPVGVIEMGRCADFCTVDLDCAALSGVDETSLAAAIVFGASAQQLIRATCVGGVWRDTASHSIMS
jgi:formimidoylglutamate deiminase